MVVTCVHIRVLPERREEFIEEIRANHLGTVREKGNIRFDVLQQVDDPDRFMIYEVFESEEAVRQHMETSHYRRFRAAVQEWMAEPRRGLRYNIIEPADPAMWRCSEDIQRRDIQGR